ncbi:unnamed protein product [Euphydryas editha]|uniref:DUF7041 domain-containing protein n=1 Tax=Euphydryas editha TaxID=104508 RepID=A0AAU9TPI5_EUPED|nr:unnamed protein product [Euphydryas editha]
MDSIEERFAALQAQNLELQAMVNTLQQQQQQTVPDHTTPPSQSDTHSNSREVFKVAAKLPPFWQDRPATWFAQVECQFNIAGIVTDQTKYDYVVAQLDSRIIGEVEDIVTQPPLKNKYLTLKAELIRRLSSSEEQRVHQLINEEELGDRRPSQFLRHLRSLAGVTLSDENILRQLWMRRLPQHLQAILAAQAELSLEKVVELADKILEVSPGTPAPRPLTGKVCSTQDISARLDELSRQVAALTTSRRARSRSRSRANT